MKEIRRKITEARDDWDFEEMAEMYGVSFLLDNGYSDDVPYDMYIFDEQFESPSDAVREAQYGGNYEEGKKGNFNIDADYFYYNGNGNIMSLDKRDYSDYLQDCIDEDRFQEWCIENGHFDDEDWDDD